jgi:hypothetical protein
MNYFSPSTLGLYDDQLTGEIPADAVEITLEKLRQLMDGKAAGKDIAAGKKGAPVLVEPPAPTADQLEAIAKGTRANLLMQAALHIAPLQDAVDLGDSSAAEAEALRKWKQYRVALGRIESQEGYPGNISWPEVPQ